MNQPKVANTAHHNAKAYLKLLKEDAQSAGKSLEDVIRGLSFVAVNVPILDIEASIVKSILKRPSLRHII